MRTKKGRFLSTLILTLMFSVSAISANSANLTAAHGYGYGYHYTGETGTSGTPLGSNIYRPVLEIFFSYTSNIRVLTYYGNGTKEAKIYSPVGSNNPYHSHRLNSLPDVEPFKVSVDH